MEELKTVARLAAENGRMTGGLEEEFGKVAAELSILRYHNLRFISRIAEGGEIGDEASLLKLVWSQLHQKIAGLGLETLGPNLASNSPVATRLARLYFTTRGETIYAGSSQIQLNILAERVLGLPRNEAGKPR